MTITLKYLVKNTNGLLSSMLRKYCVQPISGLLFTTFVFLGGCSSSRSVYDEAFEATKTWAAKYTNHEPLTDKDAPGVGIDGWSEGRCIVRIWTMERGQTGKNVLVNWECMVDHTGSGKWRIRDHTVYEVTSAPFSSPKLTIYSKDSRPVPAFDDQEDAMNYEDLVDHPNQPLDHGRTFNSKALLSSGHMVWLSHGTTAHPAHKVLRNDGNWNVMIDDGPQRGKALWVLHKNVHSLTTPKVR